jgi:hypothetical protein
MEQSFVETDSRPAGQEICLPSWDQKVHYRVLKKPALNPHCSSRQGVHVLRPLLYFVWC